MAENAGSERRLRLFIYARIIVSFLFLLTTVILQYQNSSVAIERFHPGIIRLMAFSFLFSIVSLFILKKQRITTFLTNLQIIWDLLFVTVLVLFTGGILSPYSFLYLLSILIAGMLLGRRQALYTASLCGIIYGTILDFQYFGYLSFIGLSQEDAQQFGALRLFYTISFNLIAFGLTAFVTGLLVDRARLSEEALQRMEAALKKADRLAALGELSARMAHEIRNPLAALCGSVQLLSAAEGVAESDKRLLAIVIREAARLDALISEFLLYARPTKPEITRIMLRPYIEEVLLFLGNDPRFSSITVNNRVSESLEVSADQNQLRQVIINLLQNSADAMPEGGEILIEVTCTPIKICLSITDSGTGITEDAAKHIFEPFWTTKPTGTGLGLAISYRIIEAHGGSMSVESPSSGGSRFEIFLPAL